MKRITKLLSAVLALSMLLAVAPMVSYAAEETLPYKNEFTTEGVFASGTDGLNYSNGEMKVIDGVLKLNQADGNVLLTLDFDAVSSGTFVFETDWYPGRSSSATDGWVFLKDSTGNDVAKLLKTSGGANAYYVNDYRRVKDPETGADSKDPAVSDHGNTNLNNATQSGAARWGMKFEIDLDRRVWRFYQSKTLTDGEWVYNQLKRTNREGNEENEFPFANTAASDVASLTWKFAKGEVQDASNPAAGLDNIKIYKKFTSTQGKTSYDMIDGATQQAELTFAPAADKPAGLIWESADPSIATVDADGVITAKAEGNTTITVKHDFYTDINYTYTVNVLVGADELVIDKTESTICEGDTVTLTAAAAPENTAFKDLEWLSSDESIATVENGVVTGVGKGSATITAKAIGANGAVISATSVVNVIKPLTGLSISAADTSLTVGGRTTFTAVVEPSDASEVEKKWRSGNPFIAEVDQNGVVTAVGAGTTEIYLSASDFYASQPISVTGASNDSRGGKPSRVSFYAPSGYSFSDIADMAWAQAAVYSAVETGVINPDSETVFGAKRNIKRDEFVSVMIKTLNLSNKQGKAEDVEALKNFTDVTEDNPYYAEIMKALELGIIQGVSETEFAPETDITRQDMAVVVANAFKAASIKTEEGRLDFADKDLIAEYAQTSVRILSKMGIIIGKGEGYYDPLANTTRAEIAVIVDRITALR